MSEKVVFLYTTDNYEIPARDIVWLDLFAQRTGQTYKDNDFPPLCFRRSTTTPCELTQITDFEDVAMIIHPDRLPERDFLQEIVTKASEIGARIFGVFHKRKRWVADNRSAIENIIGSEIQLFSHESHLYPEWAIFCELCLAIQDQDHASFMQALEKLVNHIQKCDVASPKKHIHILTSLCQYYCVLFSCLPEIEPGDQAAFQSENFIDSQDDIEAKRREVEQPRFWLKAFIQPPVSPFFKGDLSVDSPLKKGARGLYSNDETLCSEEQPHSTPPCPPQGGNSFGKGDLKAALTKEWDVDKFGPITQAVETLLDQFGGEQIGPPEVVQSAYIALRARLCQEETYIPAEWHNRRYELDHDWLKNNFCELLQGLIQNIQDVRPYMKDVIAFFAEDLPRWKNLYFPRAQALIDSYEQEMSPRMWCHKISFLSDKADTMHQQWLDQYDVMAKLQAARNALDDANQSYNKVIQAIPEMKNLDLERIRTLIPKLKIFANDCIALRQSLSINVFPSFIPLIL